MESLFFPRLLILSDGCPVCAPQTVSTSIMTSFLKIAERGLCGVVCVAVYGSVFAWGALLASL